MQKGSLIRSSRRRGLDVWEYRWRESCPGDKRKHRRIVIGSLDTLGDEAAALKAIVALRREINVNDARLRAKPLTLAELINHYRQRELATENEWKTTVGSFSMPHAHTVSLDSDTHLVHFPLQNIEGHPLLRIMEPSRTK